MNDKYAVIKAEWQRDGIIKLELEDLTETGEGIFVLLLDKMTGPCKYDYWFMTLDEALDFAKEEYGVSAGDWKEIPPDER